jgi:hypothetical protein
VVGVNERLEHADILLSNCLQKEEFVGSLELKDALPHKQRAASVAGNNVCYKIVTIPTEFDSRSFTRCRVLAYSINFVKPTIRISSVSWQNSYPVTSSRAIGRAFLREVCRLPAPPRRCG